MLWIDFVWHLLIFFYAFVNVCFVMLIDFYEILKRSIFVHWKNPMFEKRSGWKYYCVDNDMLKNQRFYFFKIYNYILVLCKKFKNPYWAKEEQVTLGYMVYRSIGFFFKAIVFILFHFIFTY